MNNSSLPPSWGNIAAKELNHLRVILPILTDDETVVGRMQFVPAKLHMLIRNPQTGTHGIYVASFWSYDELMSVFGRPTTLDDIAVALAEMVNAQIEITPIPKL